MSQCGISKPQSNEKSVDFLTDHWDSRHRRAKNFFKQQLLPVIIEMLRRMQQTRILGL